MRTTRETSITVGVSLDRPGRADIETPIPFLSHMLDQIARHGRIGLSIEAQGDTHIDGHHTTEDLALALGQAVAQALGDKRGIRRYGSATLPMDEACVTCAIDLSGRPFYVGRLGLPKATIGTFDCDLVDVFFEGFARGAACNLHLYKLGGDNLHHIVEVSFKAFARALQQALAVEDPEGEVPSTKGRLAE